MTPAIRLALLTSVCAAARRLTLRRTTGPGLPFCSYCVSESCRKCQSQVRVRKFQQDPTFNLIGRPRGPRMKYGWGCGEQLTGRIMSARFTICAKRPAASDRERTIRHYAAEGE